MNYRKAGDLLQTVLRNHLEPKTLEQVHVYAELYSAWEDVTARAGIPAAGVHSRVTSHERGIITVEAEHPGWIQLLQFKQNELLDTLKQRFGTEFEIRGICFFLSREPFPVREDSETAAEEDAEEELPASSLPDDAEFLETMKRLERAINNRNKQKG